MNTCLTGGSAGSLGTSGGGEDFGEGSLAAVSSSPPSSSGAVASGAADAGAEAVGAGADSEVDSGVEADGLLGVAEDPSSSNMGAMPALCANGLVAEPRKTPNASRPI